MSFGDPWIYIVLLGAAALVYALFLPERKAAAQTKNDTAREDLEATLEHYMAEVEKENEELIDLVTQMKQDFTSKQLAQQEQIVELRQRLGEVELAAKQSQTGLETLGASIQEKTLANVPATNVSKPASVLSETSSEATQDDKALAEEGDVPEAVGPATELVRDRYPELFDLYAKGKSIDMIAKTIGIQRGEVQLILQLAKREESR
ncbi:hypothetical protein ACFQ3W_13065 [Paenibacillus puldeungensis]|uniref:DUF2802 domain-containing protein n=1 Tax=Paenibacillus puldeungensis TaxID=696536 RepID=A0ABW3RZ58_9BACL